MFVVRRSIPEDSSTLLKLAKMVHFINLPPDEAIIQQKILQSRRGFMLVGAEQYGTKPRLLDRLTTRVGANHLPAGYDSVTGSFFMFTLEDHDSGAVVGTSQVHGRMGGPGNPNYFYRLTVEELFSKSLQVGTKHTVARMDTDESGPAEVGGLIISPAFRGHKDRLGRFLSLVRFHFIGLHRNRFSDRILAEMMAVITPSGDNVFWDAVGRKFVGVAYTEADQFCQYNRQFIPDLLPAGPIYLSLLPLRVQNVVGEVGSETASARRMLENLGFEYKNCIDPFDAGPYLEAVTDDLEIVRETRPMRYEGTAPKSALKRRGIISHLDADGEFYAVDDRFAVEADGTVRVGKHVADVLHLEDDDQIGVTPLDGRPLIEKSTDKKKTSKRTKKGGK